MKLILLSIMVFNLFAVEIMIDSSLSKDKRNFIKYTLLGKKEDVYKDKAII